MYWFPGHRISNKFFWFFFTCFPPISLIKIIVKELLYSWKEPYLMIRLLVTSVQKTDLPAKWKSMAIAPSTAMFSINGEYPLVCRRKRCRSLRSANSSSGSPTAGYKPFFINNCTPCFFPKVSVSKDCIFHRYQNKSCWTCYLSKMSTKYIFFAA